MARTASASAAVLLCCLVGASHASPPPPFEIKVEGTILRKTTGKVVLSLSAFELEGVKEVTLVNRRTGEKRVVGLASVYWDICYSKTLPKAFYDALNPDEWLPTVVWRVPDEMDALRDRLASVYDQQNRLRRELGNALLDGEGRETRVSSRVTLDTIEKYHRIAARLAREYLKKAREKDDLNMHLYPLRIQIGFNPFGRQLPSYQATPLQQVREAIYWEVHRILTQHFGIDDSMVDFIFDAPATIREFVPVGATDAADVTESFPSVTLVGESIGCAAYLQRQDFFKEVRHLVRLGQFRDPFITDRAVVDAFVNEGSVVGIYGGRIAVTFVPPFLRGGETVHVVLSERADEAVPIVLAAPGGIGGFTLSEEIPPATAAKIHAGMTVRRK